jgi:OmpA-OmpF porin, OOP family
MPLRRSPVLSASIAVAIGLRVASVHAEEGAKPAPASSPRDTIHLDVDLLAGVLYRVGGGSEVLTRAGGMGGLDVLVGHRPWYAAGIGYERASLGRDRVDSDAATFSETSHSLDTLWILGRVFPYRSEDFGAFVQVGLGPSWQGVSASGARAVTNLLGQVTAESFACSGRDAAGLGLRAGAGVEIGLGNLIALQGLLGVDHYRLSAASLDACAPGAGAQTALTARVGLTIGTGRERLEVSKTAPERLPPPPPSDRDHDGIYDGEDVCPDQPGPVTTDPKTHGCPPKDRDSDGVIDDQDACPAEAGPRSDDPKKTGCPIRDRDNDKVPDESDACPDITGLLTTDPTTNGCPGDTDGDGIRDDQDACPAEKGLPNEDKSRHGCPLVQFTEKEIVIAQQVQFESDRSVIRKESDGLLDQVAAVIKDHPEVEKLEVQGHTDDTGNKQRNRVLSQGRADAVKKALVRRGVLEKKLDAKGYGQEQPIGDNTTEAGRAKNRRVQFAILKKKETKPEGPTTGKPTEGAKPAEGAKPEIAGKPKAQAPAKPEGTPAAPKP